AAQTAALATAPEYAEAVGIAPTVAPERLRGIVLACGAYDVSLASGGTPAGRRFLKTVLWAYSGRRDYARDPVFARMSVVDHVDSRFPSALVTVGNADPLAAHSKSRAVKLEACGVELETLFFPDDRRPALEHEYQFDLDSDAGRLFLARMLAFLER